MKSAVWWASTALELLSASQGAGVSSCATGSALSLLQEPPSTVLNVVSCSLAAFAVGTSKGEPSNTISAPSNVVGVAGRTTTSASNAATWVPVSQASDSCSADEVFDGSGGLRGGAICGSKGESSKTTAKLLLSAAASAGVDGIVVLAAMLAAAVSSDGGCSGGCTIATAAGLLRLRLDAFGGARPSEKFFSVLASAMYASSFERIETVIAGLNSSSSSSPLHCTFFTSSTSSSKMSASWAGDAMTCSRAVAAEFVGGSSRADSASLTNAGSTSSVSLSVSWAGQFGPANIRIQSAARSRERCTSRLKLKV
mmetsp:Transcript_46738/g.77373  ORF Transcript_46738/g.77373 Transcript_46738/m.77373 type:complete len:311 (-) Transcript_46738:995-1927(-)